MAKAYIVDIEITIAGQTSFSCSKLALDCDSPDEAARDVLESQVHGGEEWISDTEVVDAGDIRISTKSVTEVTGNDKNILSRYL